MNLIRFHEPTTMSFRKSAGGTTMTMDAHRDWVFSDAQTDRAYQDPNIRDRVLKISKMGSMVPDFLAQHSLRKGAKNSLLIYNGSGGYGDQIMTWPFTLIMAKMGYEVHLVMDPGNQVCWWNMPWIKSTHILPMQYDVFQLFDHYFLIDGVVNFWEHSNQPHPLDCMLKKVGVDPAAVPDNFKVVAPNFSNAELAAANNWSQRVFGIYQLASANPVRNLPVQDSIYLLTKLAEAFPNITWLATYDEFIVTAPSGDPAYLDSLLVEEKDEAGQPKKGENGQVIKKPKYSNILPYSAPNLRELWAVTSQAKVVVAPDSLLVHVAGSMGVPCVGMWGPFDPQSRVKYYKNHHPIFVREVCPMAPCNHYLNKFPRYCPPRANRNVCEVMAAISPQHLIDGVTKLVPNIRDFIDPSIQL